MTEDLLISAAAAYVTWERQNNQGGRFIFDPSRWLNGEHWRDERPNTGSSRAYTADPIADPPPGLSPEEYDRWFREQVAAQRAAS